MKRIIKLTESDLTRIIKRVISEQQSVGGVKGNSVKKAIVGSNPQQQIIKDKWGRLNIVNGKKSLWFGYDTKQKKWVEGPCRGIYKDTQTCQKILDGTLKQNSKFYRNVKRAARELIPLSKNIKDYELFYCRNNLKIVDTGIDDEGDPSVNWLVKKAKDFGIIQYKVKSLVAFANRLKKFKSERIKYGCDKPLDSIVIGTHGAYGKISWTHRTNTSKSEEGEDELMYDPLLINSLKPLVGSNTKVFFTACEGADFLSGLKTASEDLGVKIRGAAGLSVPILNMAEKGFYECMPTPKTPYTSSKELRDKRINSYYRDSEELKLNDYLLKNNFCKKVSSSGISWFNFS